MAFHHFRAAASGLEDVDRLIDLHRSRERCVATLEGIDDGETGIVVPGTLGARRRVVPWWPSATTDIDLRRRLGRSGRAVVALFTDR